MTTPLPDCIAPEKVCVFLMLVASAYMQSISAFVAQNNGAGLPERSVKALFYGIRGDGGAGFVRRRTAGRAVHC